MKSLNNLKWVVIMILFNYGCSHSQNGAATNNKITTVALSGDSIELRALTIDFLKWHDGDPNGDFVPTTDNDSFYIGIDWLIHKGRVEELSKTKFFSKEFLTMYQEIALYLDKELKENSVKYLIGELPPYGNGNNEWCNCQDYPSNIWKRIMIKNIKYEGNIVSYYWTWGDNFKYIVNAKKEDGSWRITYLERFELKYYKWN